MNIGVLKKLFIFITAPMNMIDILAILPFYIELAVESNDQSALVALRVLRVRA
jgi:hypothetical protein